MRHELLIATRNAKKFVEIKRLFRGSGIKILSLEKFPNIPGVKENGRTFNENAAKKALFVSNYTDKLVLADDSGLEVDALRGKPGVRSSRYAGRKKNDRLNNLKLLKALNRKPAGERKARFRCAAAIAADGKLVKIVEGLCEGSIGFKVTGGTGFGYDTVFIPKGEKRAFAALGPKIKDKLSHRAKALRKARKVIEVYFAGAL